MPHRETFSDVQGGRPIIYYGVRGNLMSDVTQSGLWGVSKMLDCNFGPFARSDGGEEPYNDGQTVKIKIESMQNTYATIKRAIYLAGAIQTVIVQFDLDYYNFVDPYDLGMEITLEVQGEDVVLTIEYSGRVLKSQWDAVLAAATGAYAGGTGGTSITALTSGAFTDAEFGASGIMGVYIGTGTISADDELGLKEAAGSKFVMTITKIGDTVTYMKPVTKRVHFKNTIAMFENRYTTLQRAQAYTNTEKVITWVFGQGTTIVLHNCTKMVFGPDIKDASGLIMVRNEGSTYLDPVNATPTNVTFNDGTQTITFNKQGAGAP